MLQFLCPRRPLYPTPSSMVPEMPRQCHAGREEKQRDHKVSCTRTIYARTKRFPPRRSQDLEILIEFEVSTVLVGVHDLFAVILLLGRASHDTSLLVVTNTLLKEVGFAGQ